MKLTPHPRLYIGAPELRNARLPAASPLLAASDAWIAAHAAKWLRVPEVPCADNRHNAHLIRNRDLQGRVMTLIVRWVQTGESRYLDAVVKHVEMLGEWRHWSWIAMRHGQDEPDAIFDLSYGENSATLALAYDLCHDALTPPQRAAFVQIARRWAFAAGVKFCKDKGGAWWFGHAESNWNTVCAGGLGMLCLSMDEMVPEAAGLLKLVEKSILPYMHHLDRSGGGWPEGVGYWNYGMRYAFMYLLSHERATGRPHPLLRRPATRKTLAFPLDFTPDGCAAGFGDVNHWSPLPFHYFAADRLQCSGVLARLQQRLQVAEAGRLLDNAWAPATGWRFAAPAPVARSEPAEAAMPITHYKGQDWLVLHAPGRAPAAHLTIRGGTTLVPHGHCDLFSFNYVLGGEKLVGNENNEEYLDTTFSPRRYDLPDINAQYKNTVFLNGVGVFHGAALEPARTFQAKGRSGVLLVGAEALGKSRDGQAAEFCGRLFLALKGGAFLIIDRVQTRFPARFEARFLSRHAARIMADAAELKGAGSRARISFGANVPALLATAATAPTKPQMPSATMLRWCTDDLHREMILATVLSPGRAAVKVTVENLPRGRFSVKLAASTWTETLTLSQRMVPAKSGGKREA